MNNGKHIIHLVSNREWGGGEQYIHDLCARLKADGYQITMFIRDVDVIKERMADLNVPTMTLPPGGAFSVGRALKLARFLKTQANVWYAHIISRMLSRLSMHGLCRETGSSAW